MLTSKERLDRLRLIRQRTAALQCMGPIQRQEHIAAVRERLSRGPVPVNGRGGNHKPSVTRQALLDAVRAGESIAGSARQFGVSRVTAQIWCAAAGLRSSQRGGSRPRREIHPCEWCGNDVTRGRFCSRSCGAQARCARPGWRPPRQRAPPRVA